MPRLIVQITPTAVETLKPLPTAFVVDDEGYEHLIPAVEVAVTHDTMAVTFWRYPIRSPHWRDLSRLVDLVEACGAKVKWRNVEDYRARLWKSPKLKLVQQETGDNQR